MPPSGCGPGRELHVDSKTLAREKPNAHVHWACGAADRVAAIQQPTTPTATDETTLEKRLRGAESVNGASLAPCPGVAAPPWAVTRHRPRQ